ncbi:hypothetical protein pb186bvf_012513 [Paramecium bursaria]
MKNKFYYGNDTIQKKKSFKVQDIRKVKSMARLDIQPTQQSKTQNQISDQSFVEEPKTLQRSKTQLFSIARAKSELRSKKLLHMTHKKEQSLESEQTLMLHLGQKEQDDHHKMVKILIDKRLKSRQSQSHLKSEQSQDRKSLYLSKMTLRSDVTRDKKLNEAKFNFSCKFALAIDLIEKIAEEKITLEKLLNKEQVWNDKTHKFDNPPSLLERQGAYMKLYTNLINLPSNLKGLEFACKSLKSAQKLLKQGVSQCLENYLYENYEQGKLKQMTFKSQLFYILMFFSDLYQRQDGKYVKVNCDQTQNNMDSFNKIERLYMQSADKSQIIIETEISLKYSIELLLKQARSVYDYSIVLDINMIKQIYCFCNKVQELLEQKIVTVSQQPDYYDRNFDFLEAYKQIKCQNIIKNPNDAFSRPRLFQSVLTNQIKLFEQRYGQLDKVSNMQRQQAILADLKIEQVYHKIALRQMSHQ